MAEKAALTFKGFLGEYRNLVIRLFALLFVSFSSYIACAVPIVSNVEMHQIEGTKLVRITYDVSDNVNTALWATVSISTNGVALPSDSVTGDVNCVMSPGNGKTIIWDAGADWNGRYTEIAEAVVDVMNIESMTEEGICIGCYLAFTYSGSANWVVDRSTYYSKNVSMRSGTITHNQTTSIKTTVSGAGKLSFMWKVSSEANYDYLFLYVDGTSVASISGTVDWQKYSYTITGTSTHTIEWRYSKDGSASKGSDCGWIDDVSWEN